MHVLLQFLTKVRKKGNFSEGKYFIYIRDKQK